MNKEEYKDTNILIPDLCKYYYKEGEEVTQTIDIINQILQEKRKGKYIVPCRWLENGHQVNLRIDFDNKICEIVNTGGCVDKEVINNLQQTLRNTFKEEEWVVYENHIINQSTGNCVIASNIVAIEKIIMEKRIEQYNNKKKKLKKLKEKITNEQTPLTTIIDYDILKSKLFSKNTIYIDWKKVEDKDKKNDKTKLNYILQEIKKRSENTKNEADKKRYENLKNETQQVLLLLKIKEKQKQMHNILPQLTNSQGKLNIKKENFKKFKKGYEEQIDKIISPTDKKQKQIIQDKNELEQKKDEFVKCNLLLQQVLFKNYFNQFNLTDTNNKLRHRKAIITV